MFVNNKLFQCEIACYDEFFKYMIGTIKTCVKEFDELLGAELRKNVG